MSRKFAIVVATPAGYPNASLAIAGSRFGGIGLLDLEFCLVPQVARSALDQLASYAREPFGVKVASDNAALLDEVLAQPPEGLQWVVLATRDLQGLADQVARVKACGLQAIVEAISREEALAAESAGADGVIAKGHESGGRVGDETAFILLQRIAATVSLPIWVQGGIGVHTAAACYAAGAAGVVLDAQVLLTRESPLPHEVRSHLAHMDGSETVCIGPSPGEQYRVYTYPGNPVHAAVQEIEEETAWRQALAHRVGWQSVDRHVLLVGQDGAFASSLAGRFRSVAGIIEALRRSVTEHVESAQRLRPLGEHAPMAQSHGTRFPIVQGPMTRVTDTAAFALSVAQNGGLPLLALALMRGDEAGRLLEETRRRLGDLPWGVGILGFVPPELRQEQMEAIRGYHPPFALIAGGRPDQARTLEQEGTPTYLHVPSPGLLDLFLKDGARRFVFEGRECGGHVGPRSSFVLWESMVEVLLQWLEGHPEDASAMHVLFAGGIHDARSTSAVTAMAAPLAERGVKLGILMGSGYLFTREAVECGAITPGYQEEALRCTGTALLETGPGHSTRVAVTPYVDTFRERKAETVGSGMPADEVRDTLEQLNIGRLRIATKGIDRNPAYGQEPSAPEFLELSHEEQRRQGTYMIGQAAVLHNRVFDLASLHHDVSAESSARLQGLALEEPAEDTSPQPQPMDIAIIGMSTILPGAPDLQTFWENIVNKVDSIREIPEERWDWQDYYDPAAGVSANPGGDTGPGSGDDHARDKVYSRWGGFLDDVPFDPLLYGMPPRALRSIEPVQLLALEVARQALRDAGYAEDRPEGSGRQNGLNRERTSVVLGAGGGAGDVGVGYIVRSALPALFGDAAAEIVDELGNALPEWTEDSFAGILMNVAAGRIANRMNLGGLNCTVDAACASSLAAVYMAARELESGSCDVAIVGGIDNIQSPFAYLCFSNTGALSPEGRCKPYDSNADGISISEGVATLVLKRLPDAERDGDRIYSVIRGVGSSSDGRGAGLTAPLPSGQVRSLERAYARAGISPESVGLIEGHGTGTVAGDRAEIQSLTEFFTRYGVRPHTCALGSVKSNIGHTKCTAGVAGLIKAALALYHRVLPPTINVTEPNPQASAEDSPFYVNTEARPWIHPSDHPRCAGISAFGFGGVNFHVVVEEYTGPARRREMGALPALQARPSGDVAGLQLENLPAQAEPPLREWPAELLLFRGHDRQEILKQVTQVEEALAGGARPALVDLAGTLARATAGVDGQALCLAVVASSLEDLQEKLSTAREKLEGSSERAVSDRGIYFTEEPLGRSGKIAFLFPGQGSQHVDMLRELAILFPEISTVFQHADNVLKGRLPQPLSRFVFPPPTFTDEEGRANQDALTRTDVTQSALGAADLGMLRLLAGLGIRPQMAAGHSYGEFVALAAAGVFSDEDLFRVSEARGRFMLEASGENGGTMAAVPTDRETTAAIIQDIPGVLVISNLNTPRQTVISGEEQAVDEAIKRCTERSIRARRIPVGCAFHSPLVAGAQDKLSRFLENVAFSAPTLQVFSNTTAGPYPGDVEGIIHLLARHLASPVNFVDQVQAMYDAGARLFVEVGPRSALSRMVTDILGDQPALSVATDQPGRPGLVQLLHALGQLASHGVALNSTRLFEGRQSRTLDLSALDKETGKPSSSPTTWLVNGGRARPASEPPDKSRAAPHVPIRVEHRDNGSGTVPTPASTRQAPEAALADVTGATETNGSASNSAEPGGVQQIMTKFQEVQQNFLETQKNVMLAYLQRGYGTMPAPAERAPAAFPAPQEAPATHQPEQQAASEPVARVPGPAPVEESPPTVVERPKSMEASGDSRNDTVAAAGSDGIDFLERLRSITSERTGYPTDMLDPDADLEADLGIDSIKRVEILGMLRNSVESPDPIDANLDTLARCKTLREMVALLGNGDGSDSSAPTTAEGSEEVPSRPFDGASHEEAIERFTLQAVSRALPQGRRVPARDGSIVLVSGSAIGKALAGLLRDEGHQVVEVRHEAAFRESDGGYAADLTSSDQVEHLVNVIRRGGGAVCGVVHLLPLEHARASAGEPAAYTDTSSPGTATAALKAYAETDIKSLFLLSRSVATDLETASAEGGDPFVISASGMGGAFASLPGQDDFLPGQGATVGFTKTLAQEWPEVDVRAVDLSPAEPEDILVQHLRDEVLASEHSRTSPGSGAVAPGAGGAEVGYHNSRRYALLPARAPLDGSSTPGLVPDSSWVILVTGGARGITAQAALELGERYRPTLLLVGRTPLTGVENDDLVDLASPEDIKAALLERLRRQQDRVTPAQVERAYRQVLQVREVRRNLGLLEATGATVRYFQVDVRDEETLTALLEDIYREYGRLDGVIHGAGLIEDKLVRDKAVDSFDRVFGTKVDSGFILARWLRPESLRFLVFFSSIAGRFGNRGQADYAAANEVLNKLACYLDRRWSARVTSINWGPWLSTGMVSNEVLQRFQELGIRPVPVSVGRRLLDEELRHGRKTEAEVLIGGGWESLRED